MMVLNLQSTPVSLADQVRRYRGLLEAFDHPVELYVLTNSRWMHHSENADIGAYASPFATRKIPVGMHTIIGVNVMDYATFLEPSMTRLLGHGKYVIDERALFSNSSWAQDPVSVLVDEGGESVLLDPWYSRLKFDYQLIGKTVGATANLLVKQTPLYLEGGNILQGSDYILVGEDTVRKNEQEYGIGKQAVIAALKEAYGVEKVLIIGDGRTYRREPCFFQGFSQPIFHLDMYMTLGGKIMENGEERELVFVGEHCVLGKLNHLNTKLLKKIANGVDEAAAQLAQAHINGRRFKVVRIPLVLLLRSFGSGELRHPYYLSLNNALVENHSKGRRVYLPKYKVEGLPGSEVADLVDKAMNIYRVNGFEPVLVEGPWSDFSQAGGSMHCMVKVLRRDLQA